MQKLFLIRRGLDTFLGPMSLQEIRTSYGKMSFGFQDEISGHLGPWVPLENIEVLRKNYPEVAAIVHHDISTSWGGGDQVTKVVRSSPSVTRAKPAKGKSGSFAIGFFFMAAAAATAAFYLARTGKLNGKLFSEEGEPVNIAASTAWNAGETEFSSFMAAQVRVVVPKVLRSKGAMQNWLPYLRAYAYLQDGEIEGLSSNVLRGTIVNPPSSLPGECQLKFWQKKWALNAESVLAIAGQRALPRGHWAALVQWDPYWVRRRKAVGWLKPHNYYEACLAMATKAFFEAYGPQAPVNAPPQGIDTNEWRSALYAIDRRLNVMKAVLGAKSAEDLEAVGRGFYATAKEVPHDALSLMSCFEMAPTADGLDICLAATRASKESWGAFFDVRYRMNMFRLLLQNGIRPEDQRLWEAIATGDPIVQEATTGLEYKAEWSFFKAVRKAGIQSDAVLNQLSNQYPDVNFRDFSPGRNP